MNITFWLKLAGLALLIMVINISLSIAEVFVYSLFVPGQPESHYSDHAQLSAPWVAGIGGALQMYFFTYLYLRKNTTRRLPYALGLPSMSLVIELLIDILFLLPTSDKLAEFATVIFLATLARYAGALLAYYVQEQKTSITRL